MTRALLLLVAAAACAPQRYEGLEPSAVAAEARSDYDVFAQRCSKCHSLERPLSSGIEDDAYWEMYVARMRRQPGSGISEQEAAAILRFLHQYSLDQKRLKSTKGG